MIDNYLFYFLLVFIVVFLLRYAAGMVYCTSPLAETAADGFCKLGLLVFWGSAIVSLFAWPVYQYALERFFGFRALWSGGLLLLPHIVAWVAALLIAHKVRCMPRGDIA